MINSKLIDNFCHKYQNVIISQMTPPEEVAAQGLGYWRARILFAIFSAGLAISSLMSIPIALVFIRQKLWNLAVFDGAVWLACAGLLFAPKIRYEIRTCILLLIAYLIGVFVIINVGMVSGGPIYLFSVPVLAGALLGSRAAVIAICINSVTLAVLGWLLVAGRIASTFPFLPPLEILVLAGMNYTLVNALSAISVSVLVKGLASSNRKEKELIRYLEEEDMRLRDAKGKLEREIDERKSVETALRKSERRQRELIQKAFHIVLDVNVEGIIRHISQQTEQVFGVEAQNFIGRKIIELVHASERKKFIHLFGEVLAGKCPGTIHFLGKGKDGSALNLELRYILEKEDGRISGLFGVIQDLTEKKRLQELLLRSQKLESVGTLAGGIAHDFNNLLMGIQGRISMMMMETAPSHPGCGHLAEINDYVKSATHLTGQLLGFARGGKYEVKPINLNEVVRKSSEMFGRTKKEISIRRNDAPDIWTVEADKGQIEQVLLNLYVNAWHAMPKGGELAIETRNVELDETYVEPDGLPPGRYVRISVTDTGSGMDKATLEKIFDPFFTTKKRGRGSGLGLASVYGIVKNHRGIIRVYSEKGQGSTFSIFLPASDKQAVQERAEKDEILTGTETILLVDDEIMIIEVTTQYLKKLGYRVLTANTGSDAVSTYKAHQEDIDMIILDMIMPNMSGTEAFAELKKINSEAKVMLSSGYSMNDDTDELMKRGCSGFIQKPFSMSELSKKLRHVLDNAA